MSRQGILPVVILSIIMMISLYPRSGWSHDKHMMNKVTMGKKRTRTMENYKVPDVIFTNQDGNRIKLGNLLNSDKLVVLDFIFTTCPTICPILSAGLSNIQKKLGEGTDKMQMVSITIDPDNDTPAVLKKYSRKYDAGLQWEFLTGSREDIDRVMKAFDAFVSNKMSHYPLTFLHAPGSSEWVRIFGLMSTDDLIMELNKVR